MASNKVIATTWAKKDLVKKLTETLKRMDAEIDDWNKNQKTYQKRREAWEKKVVIWTKANVAKSTEVTTYQRHDGLNITLVFKDNDIEEAVGKMPTQEREPQYKDSRYNEVSDYAQVQNAIALIEGSTDTEFKINTTSVWASFIR
jgi:hypothetical protein